MQRCKNDCQRPRKIWEYINVEQEIEQRHLRIVCSEIFAFCDSNSIFQHSVEEQKMISFCLARIAPFLTYRLNTFPIPVFLGITNLPRLSRRPLPPEVFSSRIAFKASNMATMNATSIPSRSRFR